MGGRGDGYQVLRDFNPDRPAFLINIREMFYEFIFIHLPAIQVYMFRTGPFHLSVNSPGYNVTGSQVLSFIIFLHEGLALFITQNTSIAPYGFRN